MSLAIMVALAGITTFAILGGLIGRLFGPRRGDGAVGVILGFLLGCFALVGTLVISGTIAVITGEWA